MLCGRAVNWEENKVAYGGHVVNEKDKLSGGFSKIVEMGDVLQVKL